MLHAVGIAMTTDAKLGADTIVTQQSESAHVKLLPKQCDHDDVHNENDSCWDTLCEDPDSHFINRNNDDDDGNYLLSLGITSLTLYDDAFRRNYNHQADGQVQPHCSSPANFVDCFAIVIDSDVLLPTNDC